MASGIIELTRSGYGQMFGRIVWESISNGTAANTSTVTATIQVSRKDSYVTTGTWRGNLKVGGVTESFAVYHDVSSGWFTLKTVKTTISHNANGSGSCYIYGTIQGPGGTSMEYTSTTGSQTVTLDTIPRFAVITAAPNFNDEENPTITYSNPAGNQVGSLQACISFDKSKDDIVYRDISKTGTTYTFNLTSAERDVLRAGTTTSNSRTVYFFVRSTIGDADNTDNLGRTLTIKNPKPTINPTITDSNSATIALTGDSSKLVRYYSNAAITMGAEAVKKASLESQQVVCGNKSLTANGTMTEVESNNFVFTATDSRGNTTTKTVTPAFVNYVKLTCGLGNNMPDASGNMTIQTTGNYFNGSFGARSNSLNVYYRYKTAGGSYGSWVVMTVTKSGNTYSATANLTGLDYQTTYVFQTYAKDELATVYSTEKSIKATPVFDWSEDDFNFNVPVNVGRNLNVGGHLTTNYFELKEQEIYVGGDLNTYYPVHVWTNVINTGMPQYVFLRKCLNSTSPSWPGNHGSGTSSIRMGWMFRNGGWDGNGNFCDTLFKMEIYAKLISNVEMPSNGATGFVLYLRGGGATYNIITNFPASVRVYLENTNISLHSTYTYYIAPRTDIGNGGIYYTNIPFKLDAIYPVNSIYISYSHTSPASLFGGTWTRITNTFLWATDSGGTIGGTGGEKSHTLTVNEMPSHSHNGKVNTATDGHYSGNYNEVKRYSEATTSTIIETQITNSVGGGAAHNNMPPYIQVSIWRRTA